MPAAPHLRPWWGVAPLIFLGASMLFQGVISICKWMAAATTTVCNCICAKAPLRDVTYGKLRGIQ